MKSFLLRRVLERDLSPFLIRGWTVVGRTWILSMGEWDILIRKDLP